MPLQPKPPLEPIEAVLWDNDGVLVETESLFFAVTSAAFARLGLALNRELWGQEYLGRGTPSRQIALALGADPNQIEPVLEERNREYRRILRQPPAIRPCVRQTLSALAGRLPMAIVTGCDRQQLELVHRSSGLLDFFDLIITSDDCPHPKPHPALYLAALRGLNLAPARCIALEDSPRGLAAAHAAGIPCLAVPTELTAALPFEGALSVEPNVSGVLRLVGIPS